MDGRLLLLICMILTPLGDGMSKALTGGLPPLTIVFLRYLVAGLLALCLARLLRRRLIMPLADIPFLTLQAGLVMAAMGLLAMALATAPLAVAVGGFLISPVVASAGAALILRERISPGGWAGLAAAVVGAALITRPETGIDSGSAIALGGGACLGLFLVTARARPVICDPLSSLIFQCLVGAGLLAPVAMGGMDWETVSLALPTAGLGVLTLCCHFLIVAAYARNSVAQLSPLMFVNLIASLLIGLIWFQEIPLSQQLVGAGLIVLGGCLGALDPKVLRRVSALSGYLRNRKVTGSIFYARLKEQN